MNLANGDALGDLATLLATAYVRLLAARAAGAGSEPPPRPDLEPRPTFAGAKNRLDVAARPSAESVVIPRRRKARHA
jgi:hypothetical protein